MKTKVLVVAGPTASGKTGLGIALARRLDGEIVCADSMQIYTGMPIATAAPTAAERQAAVHHLAEILPPDTPFSVAQYCNLAAETVADIAARGKVPILVGGTGLFIDSFIDHIQFAHVQTNPDLRRELLAKDGELAAWMIGELRGLGYTEVNLNLGCPSGTVTAKGKGSGMLRDPVKLDAFLAAVFANAERPISVKTRLGVERPEEFAAILDIYNRYPICELTIHPRVMRQLYRGQADRAAFAASLPGCRMPVCYNGDVTTAADLHTLEAQYPQLSGIMVGRGALP